MHSSSLYHFLMQSSQAEMHMSCDVTLSVGNFELRMSVWIDSALHFFGPFHLTKLTTKPGP